MALVWCFAESMLCISSIPCPNPFPTRPVQPPAAVLPVTGVMGSGDEGAGDQPGVARAHEAI